MSLVYLAGPIRGCTYKGAVLWREIVKRSLPDFINTISPMRGKEYLERHLNGERFTNQGYDIHVLSSDKGINSRDFWDVKRCDIVFVHVLGAESISIGTVMEIAWARAFGKPVICCMEENNIHSHVMLNYACHYIVGSLQEGISILLTLACHDKQLEKIQL